MIILKSKCIHQTINMEKTNSFAYKNFTFYLHYIFFIVIIKMSGNTCIFK